MTIQSFRSKQTADLYHTGASIPLAAIAVAAMIRLQALDSAASLLDLRNPPSNRLHPLKHERAGQHSISINTQYRICFFFFFFSPQKDEITDDY